MKFKKKLIALNNGWIKLHRSLIDNWLWEEKPFSKGQAWVDLLMLANSKETKKPYKGEIATYKRGTVHRSIKSLAERWGWSITKADRFLQMLECDDMIVLQKSNLGSVIFVNNYEVFQGWEISKNETEIKQKNIKNKTKKYQKNTNNNSNNSNNEIIIYANTIFIKRCDIKNPDYINATDEQIQNVLFEIENGTMQQDILTRNYGGCSGRI